MRRSPVNANKGDAHTVAWPLAAMMLVQAMTTMGVVTVPVLAPVISESLGVDSSAVGAYQSLAYAGAAALTLLSGSMVRRYGGIRVNQLSVLLAASALALTVIGEVPIIALGAVLGGMAYGLATPGASHVLARVTPAHRRGLVFSVKQSAVPLGGLITGLAMGPIAKAWGWHVAILTAATLIALAALAIAPLRNAIDADRNPQHRVSIDAPGHAVRLVLADSRLRALALAAFSFAAMQLSLFAFMVTFLVEQATLDLVTAGFVFAVMQGAGIVARVLWGWVSDRMLSARSLLGALGVAVIIATALTGTITPNWSLPFIVMLAALLGLSAVGWNGIYLAEVARIVPLEQVGTATGGVLMFTFLGVAIGPVSFGAIVAATHSYAAALFALDALLVLTVIRLWRPPRQRP